MANSDLFWSDDLLVLFRGSRLIEFWPTADMSKSEKLNAVARLFIYSGALCYMYSGNPRYFASLALFGLAITLFMHNNTEGFEDDVLETDEYIELRDRYRIENLDQDGCTAPTADNPFMNVTVDEYYNNPGRPAACRWDTVAEATENHFNEGLFKDVNQLFDKNNSQRQFYTMPVTRTYNEQKQFAKWCFNAPVTCKQDSSACLRYEDLRTNRQTGFNYGVGDL